MEGYALLRPEDGVGGSVIRAIAEVRHCTYDRIAFLDGDCSETLLMMRQAGIKVAWAICPRCGAPLEGERCGCGWEPPHCWPTHWRHKDQDTTWVVLADHRWQPWFAPGLVQGMATTAGDFLQLWEIGASVPSWYGLCLPMVAVHYRLEAVPV